MRHLERSRPRGVPRVEMARGRDPRSASSLNTGQIVSCKFVTGMEEGGAERMLLSAEAGGAF